MHRGPTDRQAMRKATAFALLCWGLRPLSGLLALALFFTGAAELSAQYVNVDSGDNGGRIFGVYLSAASLYIQGDGFRDVELSDYEYENPFSPPNAVFADASQGNVASPRGGLGLGFVTLKPHGIGGGLEGELLYFDNPRLWNFGAYVNFDLLGRSDLQLAPYFKLGFTGIDMLVGRVQAVPGKGNVELTQIPRFFGRGAVDVRAGDELRIVETSLYYQLGLQLNYRITPLLSLFAQAGYHEAYYRDFRLRVTGVDRFFDEREFEIEADDPVVVNPGTTDQANLDPQIQAGPLYLSAGIHFVLSSVISDLN